jgi:hypothetical protein
VLPRCPDSHSKPPEVKLPAPTPMIACQHSDDPWVVLASVKVDAQGKVSEIDNCGCRRVVPSLANWWTRCNDPVLKAPESPGTGTPGPASGGGEPHDH